MSLDTFQQIAKTIQTKHNILVTTRANPDWDAISSALGFCLLLKRLGKKVHCAIDANKFGLNKSYGFLPEFESINNSISKKSDITLEFDINQNEINGLTYEVKNEKLMIRLFPNKQDLSLGAPRVKQESYTYDLIVVLDASDLDSLGSIHEDHAEFFYHTPIINIDHQPENEHFGELNLVEMTAVATTEILFMLAEYMQKDIIDQHLSTCLLAGIIHESKSFQSPNITPRTLAIASELMSLGADRELIIQKLFYNKAVNALQLWGRMLANLHVDEEHSIAWSVVTNDDFERTQTSEQTLLTVVDDLLLHAPEAKIIIIIYAKDGYFRAIMHTHDPSIDLRQKAASLGAHGNRNLVTYDIFTKSPKDAIRSVMNIFQ
ncbi:hypothetical protein CL632_02020 [bacterium]|jgi:phosphoesterase RecJ-like protein|nr:hypothetical protein [bacterium]MDP6756450.1 DHH family phosphoesterase [Patescibacteria group bacterium]|tara:strand:- start:32619 stop:33746 length:1128 start_codon:yes stop_codon:yes gene_type:complete